MKLNLKLEYTLIGLVLITYVGLMTHFLFQYSQLFVSLAGKLGVPVI